MESTELGLMALILRVPCLIHFYRYLHSENAFERQMVARTILDGLRECLHDQDQTEGMLEYMSRYGLMP